MAVTANTGTATPSGSETDVVTLTGGAYDNVSAYFQGGLGGGGGKLRLALYAVVNGFRTRISTMDVQGAAIPELIDWPRPEEDIEDQININAGGTSYIVTVQARNNPSLSNANRPVYQPVTVTLAGVDQFDTATNANRGALLTVAPGATAALPTLSGYAQLMDIACDQSFLPNVTIELLATNTSGLTAVVKQLEFMGRGNNVGAVFRNILLPAASTYTVQITNNSQATIAVTLTACTYSLSVTASGPVTLTGNANGPSTANRELALIAGTGSAASITIPEAEGYWYAGFAGLAGDVNCVLPGSPTAGETVVVKDEDGSLATHDITIQGSGHNIDGTGTVVMDSATPGPFGAFTIVFNGGLGWSIV